MLALGSQKMILCVSVKS